MTGHTPVDVIHNQPPLPNQHFSSWLRGQTTLFVSQIVAVLGFVLFLGEEFYYVSHLKEQRELLEPLTIKLIVDYAHVGFVTVFILVLIQVLDDNERGSYRVRLVHERVFGKHGGDYEHALEASKNQLKMFKRRFLWFWIGMLFLYVFFACQHSYNFATQHGKKGHEVSTGVWIAHNQNEEREQFVRDVSFSSESPHAGAAESASPESSHTKPAQVQAGPMERDEAIKKLAFPFVVFLFNNLTLLFIYWCFLVMDIPSDEMAQRYYKYRNGSALVMLVLTLLFPVLAWFKLGVLSENGWYAFTAIFDAFSGVINAIVLALLIARLDSKLIGLPSWLISILYSYAAVQPLFMVFELSASSPALERITTSVLIFVFISKIYFFLIIIYALQTGKLLNYLFCFPILRDRAKDYRSKEPRFASTNHTMDHPPIIEPDSRVMRLLERVEKGTSRVVGKHRLGRMSRSVSRWLRSDYPIQISKWVGAVAISYFFISLIRSLLVVNDQPGISEARNSFNVAIDAVQLVVVLSMIVILCLVRKENRHGVYNALAMGHRVFEEDLRHRYPPSEGKKQLKKFKEYFLYFWCATFLLYVAFLLDHTHIVFFEGQEGSIRFMLKTLFFPFVEFSLATLNLLFIFWCFVIFQSPAFNRRDNIKQKLLVNYSAFAVALIIAAFPLILFMIGGPKLSGDNLRDYATVFDGLIGTLSAVVLALLIARLDSKLFRLPAWSIALLFAYASIQPLFVAFALTIDVLTIVQTSVLTAALGFKVCFFLIIVNSLQSGRTLNYLVCFPFLRDRVDSIFENQFEVRLTRSDSHSFAVSIFKKNHLYYVVEKKLATRNECDVFVSYLRQRMQDRDAYTPAKNGKRIDSSLHEELGVYWVGLWADDGELLCESIPLRSEKEAHELIGESIEKIPYCKYNRACA